MEHEGLFIATHPDVYEPHDDTFLLASAVADEVQPGDRFLEVGAGTGLVSLVAARRGCRVVATDANPLAAGLARHNAQQNGLQVDAVRADLLAGLRGPFDVVAFNPPYLPTQPDEKVQGWLNLAFDGGPDGNQTVLRFAQQVLALDPRPRVVLVVHSSLSDPDPLRRHLEEAGYQHDVACSQKLWYEELVVRRFRWMGPEGSGSSRADRAQAF